MSSSWEYDMNITDIFTLHFWFTMSRGPLFFIALFVGIIGTIVGTRRVLALTTLQPPAPARKRPSKPTGWKRITGIFTELVPNIRHSVLLTHPGVMTVSIIFHFLLFTLPVFLLAHNILIADFLGIGLWSLPEILADKLTLVFLACVLYFFLRRIVSRRVRSITSINDFGVLLMTAAPFITGALAFYQFGNYKLMITLHMLTGEIALAAAPFTKIFHMVYFFVGRFVLVSEHTLGRGSRTW